MPAHVAEASTDAVLDRAAAVGLICAGVAYAKDVFVSGTYTATVTLQNAGVTPFPMNLTVVGKKKAKEKKITDLTIGPIEMTCLDSGTSASESVTIPQLTGFLPSIWFSRSTSLVARARSPRAETRPATSMIRTPR